MKWDEEQAHLQQWSHEQSKERDLPTKESPILAILLLIAIFLSSSGYGIARCKAGPKGLR